MDEDDSPAAVLVLYAGVVFLLLWVFESDLFFVTVIALFGAAFTFDRSGRTPNASSKN